MVDLSPLNLTISHWNKSPRRALQIHLPGCMQGYDYVLHYHHGKEMALPDTLSYFKPRPGPDIALDIAMHHAYLSPVQKEPLQWAFKMDVEMHALADIIISGWPNDIMEVPHPLCPY